MEKQRREMAGRRGKLRVEGGWTQTVRDYMCAEQRLSLKPGADFLL